MSRRRDVRAVLFVMALLLAFAVDAAAIEAVRAAPAWLRDLGRAVTWIGKSDWMAVVLLGAMLVAALAERRTGAATATFALRLSAAAFLVILLSGLLVQVFKHLIGRARPVHFDMLGPFAFDPLPFDYSFNSFPSGHATTMAAVAVLGCWLWPRGRVWVLAGALAVGASRILTLGHYPSDVVAGFAVGGVSAAAMLRWLLRAGVLPAREDAAHGALWARLCALYPSQRPTPPADPLLGRLGVALLAATVLAFVLFLSLPGLDIAVSGVFFTPGEGFVLNRSAALDVLREVYLRGVHLMALATILLTLFGLRLALRVPAALWGYAATALVLGPGFLANLVLKAHWGRARPADIAEFGGTRAFTLPFERADQCAGNCSFVSGEGSGIAMAAILIAVLLWPRIAPYRRHVLPLLIAVAAVGAGLRVAMGRHFLSDTVFAALIMGGVALALYRPFRVGRHRDRLSLAAVRADMAGIGAYLVAAPARAPGLAGDLLALLAALGRVLATFGLVFRGLVAGARGGSAADRVAAGE